MNEQRAKGVVKMINVIDNPGVPSKDGTIGKSLEKHNKVSFKETQKTKATPTSHLPEEILIDKSKKWRQFNNKRFAEKRKHGFIHGSKDPLPCEVLR